MKKLLSLLLVAVLALGMTTVAFAANEDTNAENYTVDFITIVNSNGSQITVNKDGDEDVEVLIPETIKTNSDDRVDIRIYLSHEGKEIVKEDNLKLDVTLKRSSGSAAMDSASIKYDTSTAGKGQAYIRLRLSEYLISTSDLDFKATMTLSSDGKRVRNGSGTWNIIVEGTYENEKQSVEADDDKMYAEDGNVFEGDEYNSGLEIVMSDDVSLIARIFSGKKYYAAINEEPGDADVSVMNQYTGIVNFVEFKTVNLSTAEVKFGYSDNLYAYTVDDDDNLVYVGRTNATLPYYSKYFISTRELDVADAEQVEEPEVEEPESDDDGDVENAEGGGSDEAPSAENNYNPGTGR